MTRTDSNNNNNNNNDKPIKIIANNNNKTSNFELCLRLTNSALLFCFLLLISLAAFVFFSSDSTTTATRFFIPARTLTRPGPITHINPPNSSSPTWPELSDPDEGPTRPDHIFYSLSGSAQTWPDRRLYSDIWWSPHNNQTRGYVYLDQDPTPNPGPKIGPNHRVSAWASRPVKPSDRIAHILKETFETGPSGVRWFVMGDDDTVFFPHNLAAVLGKYEHRRMYLVGGNSESVEQDLMHGYGTAFGGGGFAISYGVAKELVGILDGCIERYHGFYGSDEKVSACVLELGVSITKEPGFHQLDIRGDPYGLLAAHPVAPLVSLHHLDYVKPLFPGLTRLDSLKKLMQSYHVDPGLTLQQSFCYDHNRNWSASISWGYTAQLYPFLLSPRALSTPLQTFRTWRSSSEGPFVFNTRPLKADPCERPILYYLDRVQDVGEGKTLSIYTRVAGTDGKCARSAYENAMSVEKIIVIATKSSPEELLAAPRRRCCEITKIGAVTNDMKVEIRSCKPREIMSV